jgi:hypothetical protein
MTTTAQKDELLEPNPRDDFQNCNSNHTDSNSTLSIKRSDDTSLDGLFGYDASDVENENEIEVVSNGALDEVISVYCNSLLKEIHPPIESLDLPILNSKEISSFLSIIFSKSDLVLNKFHRQFFAGKFLNTLIKRSYESGNNNFNLTFDEPLAGICSTFYCKKEDPMRINITGDCGSYFANFSENIIASVNGGMGIYSIAHSKNICLEVNGNVGSNFGTEAKNFIARINGHARDYFAAASRNSLAIVNGDVGNYCGSRARGLRFAIKGNIESLSGFYLKWFRSVYGVNIKNHPKYIAMNKEFDQRFDE